MKILKKIFVIILINFMLFFVFSRFNIKLYADSEDTQGVDFENFVAKSYDSILFITGTTIRKCYLMEGILPSYLIYDYEYKELIIYCYDSYSPWELYEGDIYDEYGMLYVTGEGYCLINLSFEGQFEYGDIVNIEGSMETFVKNDLEIATEIENLLPTPNVFVAEDILSDADIIENYEIPNSFYFKNMNKNLGTNNSATCSFVALAMLLGYYDTFYDDNIVSDEYVEKEETFNKSVQNTISSPGTEKLYEYFNQEILDHWRHENMVVHSDDEHSDCIKKLFDFGDLGFIFEDVLDEYYNVTCNDINHDDNCENCFSKRFSLVRTSAHTESTMGNIRNDVSVIKQGYPIVVDLVSYFSSDSDNDIPNSNSKHSVYYDNENSAEHIIKGGHSFIAYGYIKTLEKDEENNYVNRIYYKGHLGGKTTDGSYKYSQCLVINKFMPNNLEEGELEWSSGYTFIPKNIEFHNCSKNYIYINDNCSFGICPCDSKLSTDEFFYKYASIICENNYDKFYCIEHGNHLLYSRIHQHNFQYIDSNSNVHIKKCTILGCDFIASEYHMYTTHIDYDENCHKSICACGNENFEVHSLKHEEVCEGDNQLIHYNACEKCFYSYSTLENSCVSITENVHSTFCTECEKNLYSDHIFIYQSIDEERHNRICIICDYVEIVPHESFGGELHTYIDSNGNVVYFCNLCDYEGIIESD